MSVGLGIVFSVVVVLIIALALAPSVSRERAGSVRDRFGPELDRAAAHHHGDTKAAERELKARVRRFGNLRLRHLTPAEREQYAAQWGELQSTFVDCPGVAVAQANRLLSSLAAALGYPADSHARQVEALSVRHPRRVDGIRQLHQAAQQAAAGGGVAEEMRQAFVAGRLLFDELLATHSQEASGGKKRARRLANVPAQRSIGRTRSIG
ncbi:hypothetical protein [Streptomyces sp. NPDC002853]